MIGVAHGIEKWPSSVGKTAVGLLQNQQRLQTHPDTVKISSADCNTLESNRHIARPYQSVSFGPIRDRAAPIGNGVVIPPGIGLG
jgi:hypothetical protein